MEKKCKNKKCQRSLPNGYKHKHCENCRNRQVKGIKDIAKKTLGVMVSIGGAVAIGFASKEKELKE